MGIRNAPELVILAGLVFAAAAAPAREWKIEMIDQSGPGRFTSLKADSEGNLHLAYVAHDGNAYPLKYGFWDRQLSRWFFMTVATNAGPCSLVLDSKGQPRISYVDYGTASGSKLRYAQWDGVAWKVQAIPINADVIAYYNSLVLDSQDNPTISFYEYRGARGTENKIRMRVVTLINQQWLVRTVDGQEGSGKFNGLTIDATGRIHLMYANVSAGTEGLRHAQSEGRTWSVQVVDASGQNNGESVGYSVAVVLDKNDEPHVTYMNQSAGAVKYAVRKGGKWQTQTVEAVSGVGYPDRNAIALDNNGEPCMSYYDSVRGLLRLACRSNGKWQIETVDSGMSGFTSSLQIVGSTIWIAYADEAGGGIKIARGEMKALHSKQPETSPVAGKEQARNQ